MARGWFICGGSSKDTVPRPPLRESEGDEVSVKPAAAAADEDAPAGDDEAGAPPESEAARESEFEIWNGDPDEIVAASRKSWPPSEVKGAAGEARKSWPPAKGEGSPPRAEGASPVNAYWWTRMVLAENEVDLDDDLDLDDGKSRV
jgi:hypothetical protein